MPGRLEPGGEARVKWLAVGLRASVRAPSTEGAALAAERRRTVLQNWRRTASRPVPQKDPQNSGMEFKNVPPQSGPDPKLRNEIRPRLDANWNQIWELLGIVLASIRSRLEAASESIWS